MSRGSQRILHSQGWTVNRRNGAGRSRLGDGIIREGLLNTFCLVLVWFCLRTSFHSFYFLLLCVCLHVCFSGAHVPQPIHGGQEGTAESQSLLSTFFETSCCSMSHMPGYLAHVSSKDSSVATSQLTIDTFEITSGFV